MTTTPRFDPDRHHRRSFRLQGYDYSQPGAYFVTICTQSRRCLFGDVQDGEMRLNDAGRIIARWWSKLPSKFAACATDAFVVMPNHVHRILVGADPRVRPIANPRSTNVPSATPVVPNQGETTSGAHAGAPLRDASLGAMMQWFKTMTTNEYITAVRSLDWPPFPQRLWQRNYYDHVIRDEDDLNRIRQYVLDNPALWPADPDNPEATLNTSLTLG